MSGRAKRIVYIAGNCILCLLAFAATVWIALFNAFYQGPIFLIVPVIAWGLAWALRLTAVVHELGHLVFGAFAGMKCVSVTLSYFRIGGGKIRPVNPAYAGAIEAFPRNGNHVRGKFFALAVGGAVVNLIVGGVLLALYFALPLHPATVFCGMLAPFMIYEGCAALIPAELPAGKTDGAILLGLMKKTPEEEVMLRVLAAQGILYRGSFSDIPRPLLFDVPVVREDLPAFAALILLRTQYLLFEGNREEAEETLVRLDEIEDLPENIMGEAARCREYLVGNFQEKKSPLRGIEELEKKLSDDKNQNLPSRADKFHS